MAHLSVLIPAHNAARTLPRAVSSVMLGLPRDAEVAIMNDGSTDNTGEIAEKLAHRHPQVRVFHQNKPHGVAGALNILLQRTDSQVIARMDADDVSLPGRLRFQLPVLTHADAVFTPMMTYGTKLNHWRPQRMIQLPSEVIALLLTFTNPLGHPTLVTKRHILEKVGGYRQVPAEDYDLWLRLSLAGATLHRIALPGYAYRQHGNQVTASQAWRTASWTNEEVNETFLQYSEKILGAPMQRLTAAALSSWPHREAFDAYITTFQDLVKFKIKELPRRYQRYVEAVLTRRLQHACTVFSKLN